jgi:rfaE bifunctional protein nucleotidyltransferase chain/domain
MELAAAIQQREALRQAGRMLVLTNGHFDLLHIGHLDYLEKARVLGDALFVAVNDDAATRRQKGPGRPIVPAVERVRLLAALKPVTMAFSFEGDTAAAVLEALQPDIYVKGGDYAHKLLPEREAAERYGGQVVLIDYLPGHSTSALIQKINQL